MFGFFRKRSLDSILTTFDRVQTALANHVDTKTQEQLELLAQRSEIDDTLDATSSEIDRAYRVLSKVQELTA